MFEQLRRRDDTCLERRSENDALSSTSLADRDVTTAMRSTHDLSRRPNVATAARFHDLTRRKYSTLAMFGFYGNSV